MQADFSRWTFDGKAGYRSVLLQQGRVVLDADWNEQAEITAYHDETRTGDAVGRSGAPAGNAAFGLVNTAGNPTNATAWADLRLTPGRFYVDGVLASVDPPGATLAAQPYLPAGGELPGLPEPATDGRYVVLLEAFSHNVTADETPRLREAALGGPDTTTREQTVWQVRLAKVDNATVCSGAQPWLNYTPPTMTASLEDVAPGSDPCRIVSAEGYRRLENQLYRVQIHELTGGGATYLWSRENASVVAGLVSIGTTAIPGMDALLTVDRVGRDEELSIHDGDLVEVTSVDRQLHGLPGFLATAGAPTGLELPVAWQGAAPASHAALGRVPLVRRWEGGPVNADATRDTLEDGIQVRFGAGEFRVGDYWLIPARTVRLVYGATALSGTIEWPTAGGAPQPQPPLGPIRHRATLALVDRSTSGGAGRWTLRSDCRRLFPPLTELVSIDLLGGDGQESMPGVALPFPVRVAVRNGGLPVVGAMVEFRSTGDHLADGEPTSTDPATLSRPTNSRGEVEVRWLLGGNDPSTRTLTARLLNDAGVAVGAEVRVTGHVSLAAETAYLPETCAEMADVGIDNVQDALEYLCARRTTSPGIHVEGVIVFIGDDPLENDTVLPVSRLFEGFGVLLDDIPDEAWIDNKPVLELAVQLPWPADSSQRQEWGDEIVGTQDIVLNGRVSLREPRRGGRAMVAWEPDGRVNSFLKRMPPIAAQLGVERVLARIRLRGNVIGSPRERDPRFVNGLAFGELRADGTTALAFPSVDDVHGADFTMWFWIVGDDVTLPPRIAVTPRSLAFGFERQTAPVLVQNTGSAALTVKAQAVTLSAGGADVYDVEPLEAEIEPDGEREFQVTSGGSLGRAAVNGLVVFTSNDAANPEVRVALNSRALGIIPTKSGVLRLKAPREAVADPLAPVRRLDTELRRRTDSQSLRLAVAPGFDDAYEVLRDRLEAEGIDVVRIAGDPAELVAAAAAGTLVLDGVIGDAEVASGLGRDVLPIVGAPGG